MPTFAVPIEGLTVDEPLDVGPIRFHAKGSFESLLEAVRPTVAVEILPVFEERASHVEAVGAPATVNAPTIEHAYALVAQTVDVLLVFKESRMMTYSTTFGMPGDVRDQRFQYLNLDGPGIGYRHRGGLPGFRLTNEFARDLASDAGFQFAASAIGNTAPSDGQARALLGMQLLGWGIRETSPALKHLAVVIALEAMLLGRTSSQKSFRLPRHVAYFGCGRHNENLCGRSRPACELLSLDPAQPRSLDRLKELEGLAAAGPPYCAEWLRARSWYKSRSDVAHGESLDVDADEARRTMYWATHYIIPSVLEWLATHPHDPISELHHEIGRLPTS